MFKQSSVLVAVLVLGLAAVAMSTQEDQKPFQITCETCKSLATLIKNDAPMFKAQLESICNYLTSEEDTKKCFQVVDQVIKQLDHSSPQEVCEKLTLCKKASLLSLLRY